jgi:hypothetical protein
MKKLFWIGTILLTVAAATSAAQDKVFQWVKASDETVQLDPMDYHTGRVYHPAADGGNMHVAIQSKLPVTIVMAPPTQRPEMSPPGDFRCMREHVTSTIYECHLPDDRPMMLLIRDERVSGRAMLHSMIATIAGPKKLVDPNDLKITYYRWDCVQNCIQPEFGWQMLVQEKYELSSLPKVYSLLTPDRDGEPVWVKIKAPIPMTVAVMPSAMADKIYDDPSSLSTALGSTSCKQRGVQSLSFSCNISLADGRESLVILPQPGVKVPHKKAEIEMQANECTENCNLLQQPPQPEPQQQKPPQPQPQQ